MTSTESFQEWYTLIRHLPSLQRRCYHLQILSRRRTLAGLWQDHLHAVSSILPIVRVKQCGFIGLNTLQRTSRSVMTGRMHCKGANPDNCCSHEYCRNKTFSDSRLVILHKKARLRAM